MRYCVNSPCCSSLALGSASALYLPSLLIITPSMSRVPASGTGGSSSTTPPSSPYQGSERFAWLTSRRVSQPKTSSTVKGWPSITVLGAWISSLPSCSPCRSSTTRSQTSFERQSLPSAVTSSGGILNSPLRSALIGKDQVIVLEELRWPLTKLK